MNAIAVALVKICALLFFLGFGLTVGFAFIYYWHSLGLPQDAMVGVLGGLVGLCAMAVLVMIVEYVINKMYR